MNATSEKPQSAYQQAGVNIDAGNQFVNAIKPMAQKTHHPEVLSGIGGFSAFYELPLVRYQNPVLVSCTDGVGTKLKLAIQSGRHDTIGIDLVAMCVNDLIVSGAEPLFFLDYYATGRLNVTQSTEIMKGIVQGCEMAHLSLIGGETAEMPGLYAEKDYDLAGFCVGVVEKSHIIRGQHIEVGDALIALGSSGFHSNGYSLIRKTIETHKVSLDTMLDHRPLLDRLLEPTRIYVQALQNLMADRLILGAAHITGGGLLENIPRMLPDHLTAHIDMKSWTWPAVFQWIQKTAALETAEMLRTFNCGVGMVVCVAQKHLNSVLNELQQSGEVVWHVGNIAARKTEAVCFD